MSLTRDKFLQDSELTHLRGLIGAYPCRDTLLLDLAVSTGARASELLNISVSDINHEFQSVYIKGLKGSRDREVPLRPELYAQLSCYAQLLTGRIFNFKYRRLDQIWNHYRPTAKKFHSLRHTFAIQLYKKTRDVKLVQMALGHKSINTTMIYVEYIFSQEELRRIIA